MKPSLLQRLRNNKPETTLYYLGLVGFVVVFFVGLLLHLTSHSLSDFQSTCSFYTLTGFYCPSCGGTRSFVAFLHGDLLNSISYHVFVPYFLIYYILFMMSHTIALFSKGRYNGLAFHMWHMVVGLILLFLQFILNNLPLI